tara:strand:- start:45 stop:545 length:501 start_codon:yes stop_codon:yes gene_type:complete
MSDESWRPIPDFEGLYEVSDLGWVRNPRTGKALRLRPDKDGYQLVSLYKGSPVKKYDLKVHRAVLSAFVRPPVGKEQGNHINGSRDDNRLANLEWVTCSQNHLHAYGALKRQPPAERPVVALRDGAEVLFFRSISTAGRSGFRRKSIQEVLAGNWRTHRGLEWRYA